MGGATSRMGGATSFPYPALPSRFQTLLYATQQRLLVMYPEEWAELGVLILSEYYLGRGLASVYDGGYLTMRLCWYMLWCWAWLKLSGVLTHFNGRVRRVCVVWSVVQLFNIEGQMCEHEEKWWSSPFFFMRPLASQVTSLQMLLDSTNSNLLHACLLI